MRRILLCALLLAGCPSNLEEQSRVSKLRVLAVRADPPELVLAADGGVPATTFTALAVTPTGAGVSVVFALCREITSAPSPTLPCPGDAGIELPAEGPQSARLDLLDPRIVAFASGAQLDGGAYDAGGGLAQALDEGVPLLIGFTARTGAERLDGFSTITLRSDARGPAHANPARPGLQVGDGGPIGVKKVVRLQPVFTKEDPSLKYVFSFFATAGEISSLRSTDTTSTGQAAETWVEWTAPDTPQSEDVRFWLVLRDGRSGVTWTDNAAPVH